MNIIIHVSGHYHLSGHLSFWLVPSCPDNRGSTVPRKKSKGKTLDNGIFYMIKRAKLPGYTRRFRYVECTKSFCLTEQLFETAHGSICHKMMMTHAKY